MEFINPFPVECEFCNAKSKYPVKDLLAFQASCMVCGRELRSTSLSMHECLRQNRVELWPMNFIFDGLERYGIDLDAIEDEQVDAIGTIGDFVDLVRCVKGIDVSESVFDMEMLQPLKEKLTKKNLLENTLHSLALTMNPKNQ